MTGESNLIRLLTVGVMTIFILTGCSKGSGSNENPLEPSDKDTKRQAMGFYDSQPLFGDGDIVAGDVDLASVVWGTVSTGDTDLGSVVVFPDETSWAVAVAIQDDPDNPGLPSRPWVRFLNQDNEAQAGEFAVNNLWDILHPHKCRLPKIDCTYLGYGLLNVVVAFRYGDDQYDCGAIENWNIRAEIMHFRYTESTGWSELGQTYITGGDLCGSGTGETHPDVCYDQNSGDIYFVWTRMVCLGGNVVDVTARYCRFDGSNWYGSYSLMNTNWNSGNYSPWFANLDIGKVAFGSQNPQRYVAFAYTALFPNGDWEGTRPVIGWWSIETGPKNNNHTPQYCLVIGEGEVAGYENQNFDPEQGDHKYDAGLIKVDIPADNAPYNEGAIVFVQDTCDPDVGSYEIYGRSSIDYEQYAWITYTSGDDFEKATWPSLAVHNSTGTTASVTFFGDYAGWNVFATHWNLADAEDVSAPTIVDSGALGYFDPSLNMVFHDWGTSSSLVDLDTYNHNMYWAAWSECDSSSTPNWVYGCVGFANP